MVRLTRGRGGGAAGEHAPLVPLQQRGAKRGGEEAVGAAPIVAEPPVPGVQSLVATPIVVTSSSGGLQTNSSSGAAEPLSSGVVPGSSSGGTSTVSGSSGASSGGTQVRSSSSGGAVSGSSSSAVCEEGIEVAVWEIPIQKLQKCKLVQ